MEEKENQLGTESIGKLLFKLSLPAITAQIINALYNIVDRMYIGRIPQDGPLALAALGVAFPLIMIIAAFSNLVGMGGAPRAAIKMGEGDHKGAEKILGNSFIVLLLISAALTVIFATSMDNLLMMFGATQNTLKFASAYFGIYLVGTVFVQISMGLNLFISAQGFAKVSMMTVLIGAIINIILDPLLIFGLKMGVRGAAVATVISQFISALWVLKFLFGKKTYLKIKKQNFGLDSKVVLPILALGVSPFIMMSTESLVQLTLNSQMKLYGGAMTDQYIGALSIIMSTMQFLLMPMMGLTQGAQPIISYNYGANKQDRVKKAFQYLLISCVLYSTVCWALSMYAPQIFIYIFSSDATLIELGISGMRIFMAGMALMGAQIACQNTLVALGQAKISMFLALLRKIILLIPLAIIIPKFMGVKGILVAEPVADITAVIVTVLVFTIYFKKILKEKKVQNQ